MTRKTVSERRMAGANKQIAELTQALHEAREYGTLLADDVRDKAGLIKHLKSTNNRLRAKLAVAELSAKGLATSLKDLSDISSSTITQQSQQIHELATAASATADNRDEFKMILESEKQKSQHLYKKLVKHLDAAAKAESDLTYAIKEAKSWKRGFFVLVAITVIAQVVNYVAG